MKSAEAALNEAAYGETPLMYMAIEMAKGTWKLGFSDGSSIRERNCEVADLTAIQREVAKAKKRLGLPLDSEVVVVYEAGRDGFWPKRLLELNDPLMTVLVIDPASLAVSRRRRPSKTDRIDLKRMLRSLIAYCNGDDQVFAVCHVPSERDEDDRLLERRREELNQFRTATINKIRSQVRLLTPEDIKPRKLLEHLDELRTVTGEELGPHTKQYVRDLCERLQLVDQQLARAQKEREQAQAERATDPKFQMIARLAQLKSIGEVTAWTLVMEMFGWRNFQNRREVGAYCGLTSSPWASGSVDQDQGLSRSGNTHVRWIMIQLAWRWIRFQPDSELTHWFLHAQVRGLSRKKAIVALARKLVVRLWRYLETGELPRGARLRALTAT